MRWRGDCRWLKINVLVLRFAGGNGMSEHRLEVPVTAQIGAVVVLFAAALGTPVIAARGRTILPEHLDAEEPPDPAIPPAGDPTESLPLRALLAEVERRAIHRALIACGGNRTKTAELLGNSRRQLFDKIR